MDEITLTFSKDEFKVFKYMLKGCSNPELLAEQVPAELREKIRTVLSGFWIEPDELKNLQDAVNHLSYLDENYSYMESETNKHHTRKSFLKKMAKVCPELFTELANFVFLPAKRRKINPKSDSYYTFSSDTREEVADALVDAGLYSERVIKHYFKLFAKSGSWSQKNRIRRWMKMPQVNENKLLMLTVCGSSRSDIAIYGIERLPKKMLPLLVTDVKHPYAKWYLEKKLTDSSFPESLEFKVENKLNKGTYYTVQGCRAAQYLYKEETGKIAKLY